MNAYTRGKTHEIRSIFTYILQPHTGVRNQKNPLHKYLRDVVPIWFEETGYDSMNSILKALSTLKKIHSLDFLTSSYESTPHPCASSSFPTENEISVIMPSGCLSASMFWTCFLSNWQRDRGSKRIKCLWNSWKSAAGSKMKIQMSVLAKGKVGRMQQFYTLLANVSHHVCGSGLTRADAASSSVRSRAYCSCSEGTGEGRRAKVNRTHLYKSRSH